MALKQCFGCLKCLVWLFNLIFWLAGVALLALSLWLLLDSDLYIKVAEDASSYLKGTYFLITAGVLMTLVGFLGCCGAFRESQCMLTTYFLFVLVIMIAQISAAAWAYSNRAQLNKIIQDGIKETVKKSYSRDQAKTAAFDGLQQGMHCCGADGPGDWAGSVFNNADEKSFLDIGISGIIRNYRLPRSCCKVPMESAECEAATQVAIIGTVMGEIYNKGCSDRLIDLLEEHSTYVIWAVICLGIIELIGMICSLLLCCAVRRIEDFKA
ncbi:CD9 antigen-like [Artemia franciscana]|uniref:Tetraspanin n=1 Tax=Artemia franciscana TaxID=6661 RepID=A0AA88ISD5_ARTSF|nr:hypothetical protein QYM36_000446 [Artemia franciscana]